ncbi:MAG: LptF/LptG family permease [Bacteroidales bacterium]|jgi:lipopolysaccharide export system permease protein|nr:LptF/LptG family permease [Bacteroidales bacterium]
MKFSLTLGLSFLKKVFKWRLLDTYILQKFLGSFFYSIALLMSIIVVFDVSENIQRFLSNKVPFDKIVVGYYFNFIPYFINLFIPLFTFISVIWFTAKLSQKNEIVAILSSGVNFYRLLLPYITGAFIIAMLSFVMSNFYIPQTNKRLNRFKQEYFHKTVFGSSNIHLKIATDTYIYLEHWSAKDTCGERFTYERLGRESILYKIEAQRLRYNDSLQQWILENYVERRIKNGKEFFTRGERKDTVFNITPQDFSQDVTVKETMSYKQLRRYIKEERAKGTGFAKYYQIEQAKRMANPLGTIIMTLLGLSVASRKTNRGVGVHLFIGMGLAFTFVFLQQVSDVFAESGSIPPVLGSWIPNLIFFAICIIMLRLSGK